MDRNTLRWLLQKMEKQAQNALSRDGSFLEALQALKWEIGADSRVRSVILALRARGLSVYDSFLPRVRIRLFAGEKALDLPRHGSLSNRADDQPFKHAAHGDYEPLTQELRNAASAVVATSRYCHQLNLIVNEVLQTSRAFEQLAAVVERAGYELQVCLDLSAYAEVRAHSTAVRHLPRHGWSQEELTRAATPDSTNIPQLPLSGGDLEFLKELRINPY